MDTFPMENIYELEDAISSGLENSIMASALGYANEPYVDKGFRQEVYSRGFVEIWSFAMDMMLLTMPHDKLPPNMQHLPHTLGECICSLSCALIPVFCMS